MTSIIKLKNISKSFYNNNKEDLIIDDISLDINQNELISLVGPSGSGKTTLLQIIGLLDKFTKGTILYNKTEIIQNSKENLDRIRRDNIGFIFQYHHLISEFNVIENTDLPLLIKGYSKKDAYKEAEDILTEVELDDKIYFLPGQLSGGQKQIVAIARAIIHKPSVILADEPTGNLDNNLSIKIYSLLKNMVKKHKISCIFVTHNINLAKKADKIYKLENKKLSKF